jgi:hypothetical protein
MVEQSGEPLLLVFPCSCAHTTQPLGHLFPVLCRAYVRFHGVLLGHRPSLHHLRRGRLHPLCSAASLVLCPCSTPRWRACPDCAFGFPDRSGGRQAPEADEVSRFSRAQRAPRFSTCVWLLDYARPDGNSRCRFRQCGLPVASTRSAPGIRFSKLDSSPVDASVYASPGTSRHPAQDSRSRWFATPFWWGSFIPDCTPVYPDDCAC